MRIGCLQFAPQVGDIDNNLNRADAVLNKSPDLEDLDLLVLPELAFTGYNFHSLAQITPYLEPSGSGISSLWARTTALKLNCNVVVGYPEKVDVADKWPTSPEFYNSAIMVNRDGETIANYRKSFLYAVDETWALEGRDGFFEDEIHDLGSVAMGICMDINPYKFEAPWHAFEFAFHILEMQANLVILTMAWVTRENPRSFTQLPLEPDLDTLKYWIQRLEPVIRIENEEEIVFVVANRTGIEEDCVYTGTSTVFGVKNGEVNLYGVLGRGVKEVLVVDTSKKPFAKVVRDDSGEEVDTGHTYDQPRYQQSVQTPDQPSSFKSNTPTQPSPAVSYCKDMPTGESRAEWSHVYNSAVVDSKPRADSQAWAAPLRSPPPKLELKIPTDKVPASFRNWISPHSGTLSPITGEPDIPTPTAPSPTPISLRPNFTFPETHLALPRVEPNPHSNRNFGGGLKKVVNKRLDSPITPPMKNARGMGRKAVIVSQTPPSPPIDEEPIMEEPAAEKLDSGSRRPVDATDTVALKTSPSTEDPHHRLAVKATENNTETQKTETPGDAKDNDIRHGFSDAEMKRLSGRMKNLEKSPDDDMKPPSPPAIPTRPPSTKSRNASCSRTEGANGILEFPRSASLSRMSIPIAASPSLFYREALPALRRLESPVNTPGGNRRGSLPARPEVGKEMVEIKNGNPRIIWPAFASLVTDGPDDRPRESSSRPVSRGRQPLAKKNATNGAVVPGASASTSRTATGSVDRGRMASNNRSIVSRGATSTASSASWLFGTPPPRTQPSLDPDDEIIAMINLISRSCPVHNHQQNHQQTQTGQEQQTAGNTTTTTGSDMSRAATQTPVPGGLEDSIYEIILPPNIRELVDSLSDPQSRNQTPLRGLNLARNRTSPKFDPPTPTAMQFDAKLQDDVIAHRVSAVETEQEC